MSHFLQAIKSLYGYHELTDPPYPRKLPEKVDLEQLAVAIWMLSGSNNVNDIVIQSAINEKNKEYIPQPITKEEVESYKKKICDEMLAECEDENYINIVTPKIHERMDAMLIPLIGTVGLSLGRRLRNYYPCVSKQLPDKIKYKKEHFDPSVVALIEKETRESMGDVSEEALLYHIESQLPQSLLYTHDEAIAFMNKVRDGIREDGEVYGAFLDLNTCGPYVPKGVSRIDKALCNLPFDQRINFFSIYVSIDDDGNILYVLDAICYTLDLSIDDAEYVMSINYFIVAILIYYALKDISPEMKNARIYHSDQLEGKDTSTVFIEEGEMTFYRVDNGDLEEVASIPMPDHLHELYS